jgi:hypothetical protein
LTRHQAFESARREFGKQAVHILEVVSWRRMAHSGAFGDAAERETLEAFIGQLALSVSSRSAASSSALARSPW